MEEAAQRIGCSVSCLRKIVDAREIRYYQRKRNAHIKFKLDWIDEFIANGTKIPRQELEVIRGRRPKKRPKKAKADRISISKESHGLEWDLME